MTDFHDLLNEPNLDKNVTFDDQPNIVCYVYGCKTPRPEDPPNPKTRSIGGSMRVVSSRISYTVDMINSGTSATGSGFSIPPGFEQDKCFHRNPIIQ